MTLLFNATSERPAGLICAIPDEAAHFRDALNIADTTVIGDMPFSAGMLHDAPVVMVESGMGKVNAAMVSTILFDHFKCSGILFSGIAGGLDPALSVGDVVIGTKTYQHDYGVMRDGQHTPYQPGFMPGFLDTDVLGFDTDRATLAHARDILASFTPPSLSAAATGTQAHQPKVTYAPLVSGDVFVDCVATREYLHRTFAAAAVEMEGGAIAQVAQRFARPCLSVRSLSDLAGADRERDVLAFLHETAEAAASVIGQLLQNRS